MRDPPEIQGQRSNEAEVRFVEPQGSVLGPRFFSIYVNDLPEVPSGGKLEMFADETTSVSYTHLTLPTSDLV